ncbi:class I SAM-dependent methyltransferase [Paenibacillus sp. N1-5-1-14]|uniref:class I SAM-dependent methyltransferase n=1 Tax=Paenibacillus radicibacter TaxID=2972488 RepID=UPI002158C688|nr:class I SAM-dependent methyltransferase [Paenibacillus radicibacter]MCR8642864.1 class I SAM-dependent methyltransferase [Paenibacillus radicibacter]
MKQNKYDDNQFFNAYKEMARSVNGLEAAGEWHVFQALLPDLAGKSVLDLGCGFGWHCLYAREQQASSVVGIDISENMLHKAREMTTDPAVTYKQMPVEDIDFPNDSFDVVISSLAFHYVDDFAALCKKVFNLLKPGGSFIFSAEHPIFTSRNDQNWHYDEEGNIMHWPIDDYQSEGVRNTSFLTDNVIKYHRTVATYMNNVIDAGFMIKAVREPEPSELMLESVQGMKDELRRPMFLIISAVK